MLFRLFLLFVLVPLVELTLLLLIGKYTDWWVSLLLVIVSGLVGAILSHRQGWQTFRRIRAELLNGQMPHDSLFDAALILLAGMLLLTPGVLTDLVGISMLFPAGRRFYKRHLIAWFKRRFRIQTFDVPAPSGKAKIIDSYVVDESNDER